ncbi:hypothetical protein [Chenggangzhangella methanolivorans]|uniref:Uncharacterized protein n=1 Tax=Chenggangzhangella methanolivorans TaxID=1437009 RepID=A0A9E6R723_9HYPH|nr:hypothetical protein [Chenggangzhangella methanolivorans]QZN99019.1 hypothetical protein K6K41_19405 [Chenggangzhangella methanolivorans]
MTYAKPILAEPHVALRRRVRLLGQPQLQDYLDFVREKAVDGHKADVRALVDEWRAANDHYYDLETAEAGAADEIEIREIDPSCAPLAERLFAEPRFAQAFAELPVRLALVELDRLVVSQLSVSLDFAEGLARGLGPTPTPEALFRFCQNVDRAEAPVDMRRLDDGRWLFSSESTDFRAHEPSLLAPVEARDLAVADPVMALVGVAIGYGSNFLHAVEADGRLILQNGYHRAYALRSLGVTHAVCAIQTVTRRDELRLVACETVVGAPEFYCRAARPPLLKDYFDPRIAKVLHVRKVTRMIEVALKVRELQAVE